MKINLIELKKWGDLKTEFLHMLNFCLENWKNKEVVKNSIEWDTLTSINFIKKDIIDLKTIELFDEFLLDIVLENFLNSYIMKESDNNIKMDIQRLTTMSEQEILELNEEEEVGDSKSTVYYKSLKSFGLIDTKGEINVETLNKYSNAKRFFVNGSLSIIKAYGIEYHPTLLTALLKMKIIEDNS